MWKSALYVSIIICIWQNRHKVFKVSVFIHEYMVPWTVLWVGVFVGNSTERVSDFFIIIIVHPFTARVLGAPQMILQPVFSIFPLFSSALWDLANSRPVNSLMLSSHLFLCLPCLLPPFTVPCKMVLARPDERETWPYHCSLRLFTVVSRSSCGLIACWILARTSSSVTWSCMRCVVSCGSTSFSWLAFFFGALLWAS